jgi:hypothetical protein
MKPLPEPSTGRSTATQYDVALRCPMRQHARLVQGAANVIEILCRKCGRGRTGTVYHRWDSTTGERLADRYVQE